MSSLRFRIYVSPNPLTNEANLYTLAIGHVDGPAAEIFTSARAALVRRLSLAEVSASQRKHLLHLFDAGDPERYETALNHLESQVTVVCSIEEHEIDRG